MHDMQLSLWLVVLDDRIILTAGHLLRFEPTVQCKINVDAVLQSPPTSCFVILSQTVMQNMV